MVENIVWLYSNMLSETFILKQDEECVGPDSHQSLFCNLILNECNFFQIVFSLCTKPMKDDNIFLVLWALDNLCLHYQCFTDHE